MTREDRFTNTVEDAAAFERRYGAEYDDTYDGFEPDDDGGLADEYDDDGLEHPSWCTLPPGHSPWGWVLTNEGWAYQACEPEPKET